MVSYINELAPWEKRKGYYQNIQLGKDANEQKEALKTQTLVMLESQIASASTAIVERGITTDSVNSIAYTTKDIAQGMLGLKAAFEWGISDVVWQLELNRDSLKSILENLYKGTDKDTKEYMKNAQKAYVKGNVDSALEHFLKLIKRNKNDFTAHISLGIIYLMKKMDKEKALAYFDNAINYARKHSIYYTSYALLYKALVKRDLGNIEEAVHLSEEARKLSTDLIEASYQNALYHALLNNPDKSIPLLKKAIKGDIIYCLKIANEKDFDGIRSQITEMFDEIRKEENKNIKHKLEKQKENVALLNNAVGGIRKLGYKVSKSIHIDTLLALSEDVTNMVQKNSIIDTRIANIPLQQANKMLGLKINALNGTYQEIQDKLKDNIEKQRSHLLEKKKQGGFKHFLIYFACGQVVVIPAGLSLDVPYAIYIAEGVLSLLCFYWKIILPQSGWNVVIDLQEKRENMGRIMKKVKLIKIA